MNRVNIFAIHRCINEGYGLIRIFTENIRISPTKLWRVWLCLNGVQASHNLRTSSDSCELNVRPVMDVYFMI